MRHIRNLILIVTLTLSNLVLAQEVFDCNTSVNPLYTDIQVYRVTEAIKEGRGFIGARLQSEIEAMKQSGSVNEKVQALEASYARCNIRLTHKEEMTLNEKIGDAKLKLLRSLAMEQFNFEVNQ